MSEWAKCRNLVREPKRKAMKVPAAFKESSAFRKFKPKAGVRLFKDAPPPPVIIKKEEAMDQVDG